MKKYILFLMLLMAWCLGAQAQRYALIDMEYILGNIPAYERANNQLSQDSKTWQAAVDKVTEEAKKLYKAYQSHVSTLNEPQRAAEEEKIVAKEKEAAELRRQYFGPEGEFYKKRESLLSPINDEIYEAVKEIANQRGYVMVIDRASAQSIIYASPTIDISNEVLNKLGYSN
ncbi:MAG: OmpH family outer membrane protein [Bacteroidales bacterium]|nr:OmpH family outer membrane protein [Bacteroidales bacterium]